MTREEFLRGLEEALTGEVPVPVIRENLNYYGSYISQEMAKGRTMDEIVAEIGEPRIVARTIIDSSEAAEEAGGFGNGYQESYEDSRNPYEDRGREPGGKIHYFNLNKWYWRILIPVVFFVVVFLLMSMVSGIFYLLIRFAGPIILILLIWNLIRNMRR